MSVIVHLELRKGLGINHIPTAMVLENLFYGPSTRPGIEEDAFIYEKAWGMINGRNMCNSDIQKYPKKLAINVFQKR